MSSFLDEALKSQSWVWREARKVLNRLNRTESVVTFQTGFGPSGLPHIGTFGEVLRTTMVMRAFARLSPKSKVRLIVFSDDMDGLRKVPEDLPNRDMLKNHMDLPLSSIPDPHCKHKSFAHYNNAKLVEFLDSFGFDYQFQSSSDLYRSGFFDDFLVKVLNNCDKILDLLLPTLGEERRVTYSPFMPICPKTGKVLQVKIKKETHNSISYQDKETGEKVCLPVTNGNCKLQWKVDWAMRWLALDVDYEMCGKDLRDSFALSSKICRVIGGNPPEGFIYEMFLDEDGSKISKSKGNGLKMEEWLRYAPQESLAFYMYPNPSAAKKLSFDAIPRAMDNYLVAIANYPQQSLKMRLGNPAWHIHNGEPPPHPGVAFSLLLNLASTCNAENEEILWSFVEKYKKVHRENHLLKGMVKGVLNYYKDKIVPTKEYRPPTEKEHQALLELKDKLLSLEANSDEHEIQACFYEVGRNHDYEDLRVWFEVLYQVLIGQDSGPRWGHFASFYGLKNLTKLIDEKVHQN